MTIEFNFGGKPNTHTHTHIYSQKLCNVYVIFRGDERRMEKHTKYMGEDRRDRKKKKELKLLLLL